MPTPKAPAPAAAPTKNIYHLVLYQFRNKNKQQDFIDFGTYDEVKRRLDLEVKTPRETNEIVLWLESPGGDPHKAYKLVLELRSRAARLSVVVPDYAKSAATLMVLGMDKIFMGAAAGIASRPLTMLDLVQMVEKEERLTGGRLASYLPATSSK